MLAANFSARIFRVLVSLTLLSSSVAPAQAQDAFGTTDGSSTSTENKWQSQTYEVVCDYNFLPKTIGRKVSDPPYARLGRDPFREQLDLVGEGNDPFEEETLPRGTSLRKDNQKWGDRPVFIVSPTKPVKISKHGQPGGVSPGGLPMPGIGNFRFMGFGLPATQAVPDNAVPPASPHEPPKSPFIKDSREAPDGLAPPVVYQLEAPELQGATNGTIGLQSESANDIALEEDVFQDPQLKAVRITYYCKNPDPRQVRRAVRLLKVPGPYTIKRVATNFLPEKKNSLSEVLTKIQALEYSYVADAICAEVVLPRSRKWKQNPRPKVLVLDQHPVKDAMIALFDEAARLEKDSAYKNVYLGASAAYRSDWTSAWRHFEVAHELAPTDYKLADQVIRLYRCSGTSQSHEHDSELCIWYARYLRYVPNWRDFETAWTARACIESHWSHIAELENQRCRNAFWEAKRMPLRVYFEGQGTADFDSRLKDEWRDCIAQWIVCSNAKLDYVETNDAKNADIVCKWAYIEDDFGEGISKTDVPKTRPRLQTLATTFTNNVTVNGSSVHNFAEIVVYARSNGSNFRLMGNNEFRNVYLHEIGHALGIHRHLDNSSRNVMYSSCSPEDPNLSLTREDVDMINRLYHHHPVNVAAVEKFIGLRADCKPISPVNTALADPFAELATQDISTTAGTTSNTPGATVLRY